MTGSEKNIFGTDGIRDRGGRGWLAPEGLSRLGGALVAHARRGGSPRLRFLIARDPRPSGPEIERVLAAALVLHGATVVHGGILPTPAVSVLVSAGLADFGIVISASHNPPEFNGVKLFGPDGAKLSVEDEEAITADALSLPAVLGTVGETEPPTPTDPVLLAHYLEALVPDGSPRFLSGLSVVIDCACGATSVCAAEAFRRAGAAVRAIHAEPDGMKINDRCGSTHPEAIAGAVLAARAEIGIAFDGDGDRAILVDETGAVVDGDEMLALWALDLKRRGRLPGDRIVVTVMSNGGMERFLAEAGIGVVRTPVGDREVHRAMLVGGIALGGEQSGHIIHIIPIHQSDSATGGGGGTGDGIRTGLALARLVLESGMALSSLRAPIPRDPQTLLGVEVTAKPAFDTLPEIREVLAAAESALGDRGRVLLRYSGTEPLARVLVEGIDGRENEHWAAKIAEVLRAHPQLMGMAPA